MEHPLQQQGVVFFFINRVFLLASALAFMKYFISASHGVTY